MMLNQIKRHLLDSIDTIAALPHQFVKRPDKDFSRNSSLSMTAMMYAILAMGGRSLAKELLDLDWSVSTSAFVQRRYKIKSQAFYALFKEFTSKIPNTNPLPIIAADGSDVPIPINRFDTGTHFITGSERKPYNLIHINALYDIERGIYHDVLIQDKRQVDERGAFLKMMHSLPFEHALVIMDRGYESYNIMAHCQERNWFYLIRIRDGRNSIKSSLDLPNTPCFDKRMDLKLYRKQTKEMKQNDKDFPKHYHFLPHHVRFDFLPSFNRKDDPSHVYHLHCRLVRLEVEPGKYETLITNKTILLNN